MSDPSTNTPDVLKLLSEYSARYRNATLRLSILDEQLADLRKKHAEILEDNERKRQESALLDEEIKMLEESINITNQQVIFNREVARPQLRAEVKRLAELVETKKKYYKEKLENCAKLWKTYEAKYNKFPRVAERNELVLKVKLLRIKVMQARQDLIDKQKQLEEWQQIQALQAEVLRKQFKDLYQKDQEAGMKNEAILKEIEETKARIAQKEEAKQLEDQRRREEEKQKKLKDNELELQALQASTLDESQKPDCSSSSAQITFPTLSIPKLDDILPLSAFSQKAHEGLQGLKRRISSLEFLPKQAAKPQTFLSISQPSIGQSETICGSQKVLHSTCSSTNKNTGLKADFQKPTKFSKSENNNFTVVQSINHARSPSSSGGNKKELMFRTDSIVAIMKETLPVNAKLPSTAGQNGADISSSKIHQEIYSPRNVTQEIQKNVHFEQKMVVDADATQCNELSRTNPLEKDTRNQGGDPDPEGTQVHDDKSFERCGAISQDMFANELDENSGTPPKDQQYDFNNEFGEDLYNSLGSPPQFDSVMSPVHASFDSSPPLSIDENIKDTNQTFSYDFFSQTTSNYFGGPSSKEDKKSEKPKAATSYSFLFQ